MLCPKIVGTDPYNPEIDYELQIPAYLEFDATFSSNNFKRDFHPQTEEKMKKELRTTLSLSKFRDPHACHIYIDQDAEFINHILSSCPLPINQGPIIPVIDNDKSDLKGENLIQKVAWRHSEDQMCAIWSPHIKDDSLFPKYTVEPINSNDHIQGPCSDNSNMGIVYTCIKMHCRVKCPCKICFSKRTDCRRECGGFQCPKCTLQCPRHKVQMDRKFDQERHAFTLKGDKKDCAKFRVKHAGIPIDCIECVEDLKDHRTFHKVIHLHCKFCFQMKVLFAIGEALTFAEYVSARIALKKKSIYTCSTCGKIFYDKFNRKRHELTIHENLGKFECNNCSKKFANLADLQYHKESHHSEKPSKVECDMCGKCFKNNLSLQKHKSNFHVSSNDHKCDNCNASFTLKDNLMRHRREDHSKLMIDWNQIHFREELMFKCNICEKYFKRKHNLKVHQQTVHQDIETYDPIEEYSCMFCSKQYSSKSNCTRHQKKCKACPKLSSEEPNEPQLPNSEEPIEPQISNSEEPNKQKSESSN